MALILYSNGILEEYISENATFEYKELISTFDDYDTIQSYRLSEIPNCWVIWGELLVDDPPDAEYNRICSEIIDEDVFSHMIFIHDSELNIEWKVTDDILQHSYSSFVKDLGKFIKGLVEYISAETEKAHEEVGTTSMIFLNVIGSTKDKRILYEFDPDQQSDDFYIDGWDKLSQRIFDYINHNYDKEPKEINKPFVLYADTKVIVIAKDKKINTIIEHMLRYFGSKENYEACSYISRVREDWHLNQEIPDIKLDSSIGSTVKKRGRPPKNKDND